MSVRNCDLAAKMARVQLRDRHQDNLRHKLEMLKAQQGWQQLDLRRRQVMGRRLLLWHSQTVRRKVKLNTSTYN
jgi:hypothetical protein